MRAPRWLGRTALLLAAIAVFAAGGVLAGGSERRDSDVAVVAVDTASWYVLVNRNSGQALTDLDRDISDGAAVAQSPRDDEAWQLWQFIDAGDGYFRLRNQHSNKVLTDANNPFAGGSLVAQTKDTDGVEQRWRLERADGDYVRLVNRVSEQALTVQDASTSDGAIVGQGADHNRSDQQWQLVRVGSADFPEPESLSGALTVHDPTVVKLPDEAGYLMASTGRGIDLKTSPDRVTWSDAGAVFPDGAPWARAYTDPADPDVLWAPDISYHRGRYYLYYSASRMGSFHSAVFLATSNSGDLGTWVDHGLVIESRASGDFNAIDPNLLVDDQERWWLAFGSYGSGIKMVRIDPATGKRHDDTMLSIADRNGGSSDRFHGPQEAPYIVNRGAYYYLYMSFDHCCAGTSSDYRVMVARSSSPAGPYVDKDGLAATSGGGTEILAGHGAIHGPGHQAVLSDTDGDILFYHYYSEDPAGEPACHSCALGVNHIGYDDAGWPYVR